MKTARPTTATSRIAFMTGPPLRYHSSTVFISTSLRTSVGSGARDRRSRIGANVATSPVRRRRVSAYRLRGAGGVPDGGRDPEGGRAVESAVDREVVSDRLAAFDGTMSSGGKMDGQKSWSRKPGTS